MASKETKKNEVLVKTKRMREISIISIIIIYIVGIAAIGLSAYAFAEQGFIENKLGKVSAKFAKEVNSSSKSISFIDASLDDNVCTNTNGSVRCRKNISDSSIIKGYILYLTESYGLEGDKKVNIESELTVNGTVIHAEHGYEFDTLEAKKFGGNTYVVANLYNQSGDSYSVVINSVGNVVFK